MLEIWRIKCANISTLSIYNWLQGFRSFSPVCNMNCFISIFILIAFVQGHHQGSIKPIQPIVTKPPAKMNIPTNLFDDPFKNEFFNYYIMHAEQIMKIMKAMQELQRGCKKAIDHHGKIHYYC